MIAWLAPRRITCSAGLSGVPLGVFEDSPSCWLPPSKGIGGQVVIESWRGVCSAVTQEPIYFIGPVIGAIAAGALLWEFDDASRDKSLTGQAKS